MNQNFIYKYIDHLPIEQIHKEIITYHQSREFPSHFYLVDIAEVLSNLPTLSDWFRDQRLISIHCAHLVQKANSQQALHIDTGNQQIALNFPVEIVDEAYTAFYKFKGKLVDKLTPKTGVRYQQYIDNELEELGRYCLTQPTLINIKLPHRIVNLSATNRYCFSFRFAEDPWRLTY